MMNVQDQIFECLRDASEFAHLNGLHKLLTAIDRAEEAAIEEVLGIDLTAPIDIENYSDAVKGINPDCNSERV